MALLHRFWAPLTFHFYSLLQSLFPSHYCAAPVPGEHHPGGALAGRHGDGLRGAPQAGQRRRQLRRAPRRSADGRGFARRMAGTASFQPVRDDIGYVVCEPWVEGLKSLSLLILLFLN